jgi:hypothetical protein
VYLSSGLTEAQISSKATDNSKLFSMANSGNMPAFPSQYVVTGITESSLIDQAGGSTGSEYTLLTAISEVATPNLTFDGSDESGNTLMWWSLNMSISAPTVNDESSGGTNDGTLTNGAAENTNKWGSGILLDGDNDYVDVPNFNPDADIGDDNAFSVIMWVKPTETGTLEYFAGAVDAADKFYMAINTSDRLALGLGDSDNVASATSAADLTIGDWNMIAMTSDGGGDVIGYVNGIAADTLSGTDGDMPNVKIHVGALNDDGTPAGHLEGEVAQITILNAEITAAEMLAKWIEEKDRLLYKNEQGFVPSKDTQTKIGIDVDTDGGQTITATLHDTDNTSYGTATLATGATGRRFIGFPQHLDAGTDYHFHLTVPSGTTKVETGTAGDMNDCWFRTYYAEHTKNPALYGEDDLDTVLQLGKETVDQSFTIDDGTEPLILNDEDDWLIFTFQPTKTKLSKIKVRGDITGTEVSNCRIRLYEYDTTNDQPTGSALATAYLSPQEASTTKTDLFINLEYGIDDGNILDITKTYAVQFDDAGGDASNYWTFYGQTTSALDDADTGRVATSTDEGSTWTESTTQRGLISTFYPDTFSCKLVGDAVATINDDGTGTYQVVLTGDEITKAVHSVSGSITVDSSGQINFGADNDYAVYKFTSPFPMKNITLDYTVNPANNGVEVWVSDDNINYELVDHIESGSGSDNVNQTLDLSSTYDDIITLYVKFASEGSTSASIVRAGINTADTTTLSARRIKIKPATDTTKQSHDEISSGRAKFQVVWNNTYSP